MLADEKNNIMFTVKILAIAAFIPIILVSTILYLEKKNIVIYLPKARINYSFYSWDTKHSYCIAIAIGYTLFLLAGLLKKTVLPEINIYKACTVPILLITASTIALLITHYELFEKYKKHSALVKFLVLSSAIGVAYESSTTIDESIAQYTSVNASSFPEAQKILTTLCSIAAWLLAIIFLNMGIYFLIALITIFKIFAAEGFFICKKKTKRNSLGAKSTIATQERKDIILLIFIMGGSGIMSVAPTQYMQLINSNLLEKMTRSIIVDASFHLDPKLCNVQAPAESKMSLLPFKQAAIAIPNDELNYEFLVIACERKLDTLKKLEPPLAE